jgi:hypothetical protein
MTFEDAKQFLHIADNAYNVEAYSQAAEILEKVAYAVAYKSEMNPSQRKEISDIVKKQLGRFQFCPDECSWENVSGLTDLLKEI